MEFKEYIPRKEVVKKENEKYNLDIDYRLVADESRLFENYDEAYDYTVRSIENFEKEIEEFNKIYESNFDDLKNDITFRIDTMYNEYKIIQKYIDVTEKVERYSYITEFLNLHSFQKDNILYNNEILDKEIDKIWHFVSLYLNEFPDKYIRDDYDYIYNEIKNNDKYIEHRRMLLKYIDIVTDRNDKKESEKKSNLRKAKDYFLRIKSKVNNEKNKGFKELNKKTKEKNSSIKNNGKYSIRLKNIMDENWEYKKIIYNAEKKYKEEMFDIIYDILEIANDIYDKSNYSSYFSYIYSDDFKNGKKLNEVLETYNRNYKNIVDKISAFVEKETIKECKNQLGKDFSNNTDSLEYAKYHEILYINRDYEANKTIVDDIFKYMKNIDKRIYKNLEKAIKEDVIDLYNFGMKIQRNYLKPSVFGATFFISIASNISSPPNFRYIYTLMHELGHSVHYRIIGKKESKSTIITESFAKLFSRNFLVQLMKDKTNSYGLVRSYIFNELVDILILIDRFNTEKYIVDEMIKIVENEEFDLKENDKKKEEVIEELSNKYMKKTREVTNKHDENIKLLKYNWLNSGFNNPYNEFHYILADIISINMLMKLEEDSNYNNKIYEAMKKSSDLNCYEILDILDISVTEDSTYDNILKYTDRLCEYITKVEKES